MKKENIHLMAEFSLTVPIVVVSLFFLLCLFPGAYFMLVYLLSPLGFLLGFILGCWALYLNSNTEKKTKIIALLGVLINLSLLAFILISLKDFRLY